MNLNLAICDDDMEFLENIANIINTFIFSQDSVIVTYDTFTNPESLIISINKGKTYNIFFLDVEMPSSNGIDVARKIRSLIKQPIHIVFISNYPEYMEESFNIHPFFYMQKPVTKEKLFSLLYDLEQTLRINLHSYIVIADDLTEYPVNIDDIVYIEVQGMKTDKLTVHLFDKHIHTKGRLIEWKTRLMRFAFFECYRGILVNIEHIHFIKNHMITFDSGEEVPVSRKYEKKIKNEMTKYVLTYFK